MEKILQGHWRSTEGLNRMRLAWEWPQRKLFRALHFEIATYGISHSLVHVCRFTLLYSLYVILQLYCVCHVVIFILTDRYIHSYFNIYHPFIHLSFQPLFHSFSIQINVITCIAHAWLGGLTMRCSVKSHVINNYLGFGGLRPLWFP